MAIRYLSEHDSPDDPGGLIREVLLLGDEFQGAPEDIVLAWILRLGDDRDPAGAAKRLVADYRLDEHPQPGGACGKLIEMLKETAAYPAQRMARHMCAPRRRGGWRRNRSSSDKP
jgi:hypothetical protein